MKRPGWIVAVVAAFAIAMHAREASAGIVVVQGVELQVPAGWKQLRKGNTTKLAPAAHTGRAV